MSEKNRMFQVIKGTFGQFHKPHIFSESTLREMNPAPVAKGNEKVDLDAYYSAIIARGLALGVIMLLPDDAPESPKPIGPGTVPGAYSASIGDATQAVLAQRQAASAAVGAPAPASVVATVESRPTIQHGGTQAAPQALPAPASPSPAATAKK